MSLGTPLRVDVDGASIAYFEAGQGPPLVFVHGYFLSAQTWRKVIPSLQDSFRCLAVDLLGAGATTCEATADLSANGQARMLVGFLDALRLPVATLVAHDSGAVVTRVLAATSPTRVDRLVLSDTELPGYRVRSFTRAEKLVRLPGVAHAFEWLLGSRLLWNRLLRVAINDLHHFDAREFFLTHRAPLRRSRQRRRAALQAGVKFDSGIVDTIEHDRLVMPKLVLWGDRDAFISARRAREFYDTLPTPKQFSTIENCGTLPHEERPDRWVEAVRAFLAGPAPPTEP